MAKAQVGPISRPDPLPASTPLDEQGKPLCSVAKAGGWFNPQACFFPLLPLLALDLLQWTRSVLWYFFPIILTAPSRYPTPPAIFSRSKA
jgi:hypothetical protein